MPIGLILTGGSAKANVALAKRAEQAGIDAVFSVEFFNQHGYVVLGAIAQETQRVRIGTGIANSFTRSPVLHASAALDLDELSDGRMVLGIGSGTKRMNEEWYGVPFSRPAARTRELVRLLRALFSQRGFGFRFDGEFWKLRIPAYARPGKRRESIPIWVAGVNERMARAAGAEADGLVGHPIATRRWHRERTLPWLRAGEEETRRPSGACRLVPYVMASLHPDRAVAIREAKGQIGFYYTVSVYHSILQHHGLGAVGEACRKALARFDVAAMAEAIPDALVDEIAIACPPDEARDRLAQWKDLTDEPLLYAPSIGLPPERVRENVETLLDVFGSPGR
ncbi:MAG TPA: LLM class flavin-dependent oxidoreductase [Myxococcota bacterium]|nr:LLM class flavin-dependent oxidoreductase [Myxococcota bacterium]